MPFTDSIKMVDVMMTEKSSLTATPNDVRAGKQFIGSTQHIEMGTLPANPARSDITIASGESFNIPYGINPNAYNVIAKGLSEQTPGNATEADIMLNKTAWVNGEKIIGTLNTVEHEEVELLCGETYYIPRGFHDGSNTVSARNLRDQTMASISADNVLEGNTCWANGEMITGTMKDNASSTITLTAGSSYTIPAGKHSGSGRVVATSLAAQTPGNATSYEIAAGYSAWVNGERVAGGMPTNPADEVILPMNGTYNIPAGYHNGNGSVTQNIPSKEGQTIGPTKEQQVIPLAGYYMEGDIIVTGIDALNYNKNSGPVKNSAGDYITNYALTVSDYQASIEIYVDNWHNNASYNVYRLVFTNLVDKTGSAMDLDTIIVFDNEDPEFTIKCGIIEITINKKDSGAQYLTFNNIGAGNISISEKIACREFGA